jgi:HPt (histidine-containing phosphotransfer) domain-containing protein
VDINNKLVQLNHDLLNNYIQSLSVEVVNKMIALYREQVVIYLVDIESALQCNDSRLWQEHCHKMKGAAGSIGLQSLHAQLVLMEKTTADITEKAQQLAELKDHNKHSLTNVNAWLEQHY